MSVGDVKTLALASNYAGKTNAFGTTIPAPGDTISIKIVDVKTNQLISSKDVRL